jgi:hypothetical protein
VAELLGMGTDSERAIRWLIALMVSLQVGEQDQTSSSVPKKSPATIAGLTTAARPVGLESSNSKSSGEPDF